MSKKTEKKSIIAVKNFIKIKEFLKKIKLAQ